MEIVPPTISLSLGTNNLAIPCHTNHHAAYQPVSFDVFILF
jgi:hypothetical protein